MSTIIFTEFFDIPGHSSLLDYQHKALNGKKMPRQKGGRVGAFGQRMRHNKAAISFFFDDFRR